MLFSSVYLRIGDQICIATPLYEYKTNSFHLEQENKLGKKTFIKMKMMGNLSGDEVFQCRHS